METSDDDITCTWSGTLYDVRLPLIKTEPGSDPMASVSPLVRALPQCTPNAHLISNASVLPPASDVSTAAPPPPGEQLYCPAASNVSTDSPPPPGEQVYYPSPIAGSSRAHVIAAPTQPTSSATLAVNTPD